MAYVALSHDENPGRRQMIIGKITRKGVALDRTTMTYPMSIRISNPVIGGTKSRPVYKMEAKDLNLAGRKGLATTHAGRAAAIMALRDNQLMVIIGKLQARVAAVLEGKAPSIATTTLYNEVNSQVGPDSLFGGIFPGLPSGDEERLPPLLRSFRTGALLVSLPKGKATLRINLHFEDKEKAKTVTQKLPSLLRLAGSQYPGMKDSGGSKAHPKKGWAYVDFKLEDRTFTQIAALLRGLLFPSKTTPNQHANPPTKTRGGVRPRPPVR